MLVELGVSGGTDKTVRFQLLIRGESCGELQVGREDFTRLADLIFGQHYKLIQNGEYGENRSGN